MPDRYHRPEPGLWLLFTTWLSIGIQSFGGGSATLFLIHQACIDRGWLDEAEFARAWALVQVSPGVNLVKLCALVGHQLRGWPGLISALAGLLVPSAVVTILMTAGFTVFSEQPALKAAMRGIAPATIGLSLAMATQMAQPLLRKAHREGVGRFVSHIVVLAGAALLLALAQAPAIAVLGLAGGFTAVTLAVLPQKASPKEPAKEPAP